MGDCPIRVPLPGSERRRSSPRKRLKDRLRKAEARADALELAVYRLVSELKSAESYAELVVRLALFRL